MVVGGVLFGLLMGFIFSRLIGRVNDNEHIEITLTMLVAHLTFILTEVLSHHLVLFGQEIKLSSIIATVMASMVIGNYGRFKISPRVEEYMEKFWGYFAFLANSLVFILMGLLFAALPIHFDQFLWPIALTVVVVALGRALYLSGSEYRKLDEKRSSYSAYLAASVVVGKSSGGFGSNYGTPHP